MVHSALGAFPLARMWLMTRRSWLCALGCLMLGSGVAVAEGDFPPILSPSVAPGSQRPMVAPPERFYARAEYLLWFFKKGDVAVPLVTTGDFASPTGGLLGDPTTVTLFGPGQYECDGLTGGRLTVGMNLTPDGGWGLEVTGFGIERGALGINFRSDTAGSPPLFLVFNSTTPFFGPAGESGATFAAPAALGGPGPGGIALGSQSLLWGLEANFASYLWRDEVTCVQLLAGPRYLDLEETFQIDAQLDSGLGSHDRFRTRNKYLGGQVGIRGGFTFCDDWTLEASGKLAVGNMRQTLDISGESYRAGETVVGGFYAVANNIGRSHRDSLAVVPEVGVRLSYHPLESCRIFLGYDFLYLNNVIRASEEINRNINGTQIPNAFLAPIADNNPSRLFTETTFWAHGLNVGFEVRF